MPTASAPYLYVPPEVPPGLDPEFVRVLRLSNPSAAPAGLLTFAPPAGLPVSDWLAHWRTWRDGAFARVLAPALFAAAAHSGKVRELREVNVLLSTRLDLSAARRSGAAGDRLLHALAAARGERWLAKWLALRELEDAPVHFATVFGAQSSLFHLPLRQLLPSYGYWEWIAAMHARPPAEGPLADYGVEAAALSAMTGAVLASGERHVDDFTAAVSGS